VPDNELSLELKSAFEFSKALPIAGIPKTESNFYKPFMTYANNITPLFFISHLIMILKLL
jgi:hypothetical protein